MADAAEKRHAREAFNNQIYTPEEAAGRSDARIATEVFMAIRFAPGCTAEEVQEMVQMVTPEQVASAIYRLMRANKIEGRRHMGTPFYYVRG